MCGGMGDFLFLVMVVIGCGGSDRLDMMIGCGDSLDRMIWCGYCLDMMI